MTHGCLPLVLIALQASCAPAGPGRLPTPNHPIRTETISALRGTRLGGLAGLYRLAFNHTEVSSCSRTFDISTTRGSATLDLRSTERASLVVSGSAESNGSARDTGKPYRYVGRAERCRWSGAARRTPTGVAVELMRAEKPPFACSWDGTASGDKTPKRFTIVCKPEHHVVEIEQPRGAAPTKPRRVQLLSCAVEDRIPRALTHALLDGALVLSRDHRLHLSRSEGDTMGITQTLHLLDGKPGPQAP